MTAQRPPRWLIALALLVLVTLGLLASACRRVAAPEGWASPVLSGDLLLAAHRDRLFALEPESLAVRWSFPPENGDGEIDVVALYGTPAVTDGTVFVPGYDGNLYALERTTGNLLWTFEGDEPIIGGVAASQDQNTVYFGSSDGNVYALDAASGVPRWTPFETGEAVWSTPAVAGDTLYVTSLDSRLYALDAASGSERWSFDTGAGIASPPVVDEGAGLVYVGGFDSRLRAIDMNTHEERWSLGASNWFWNQPLVADGVVYAGSLDSKVYAVDALTGDPSWPLPFATRAPVRSAPVMAAAGVLIVADRDGNVYSIDPGTGGSAAADGRLPLESDVLADPLVRIGPGAGDAAGAEEVLVVTTEGTLVRIDPATLQTVGQKKLTGD